MAFSQAQTAEHRRQLRIEGTRHLRLGDRCALENHQKPMTPIDLHTSCEKADGYITLGLIEKAWEILDELPPEAKTTEDVISLQVEILLKSNEPLKASFLAETLAYMHPDDPEVLVLPAKYKFQAGDTHAALAWLQIVGAKCQSHAEYHYLVAQCQVTMGNTPEAIESLGFAFQLNRDLRLKALDDPAFEGLW